MSLLRPGQGLWFECEMSPYVHLCGVPHALMLCNLQEGSGASQNQVLVEGLRLVVQSHFLSTSSLSVEPQVYVPIALNSTIPSPP